MIGVIKITIVIQIILVVLYGQSQIITNGNNYNDMSAYECGFKPVGDAREQFDIAYYIIGILYQIFDQEVVQIFPLAVIEMNQQSQIVGEIFIIIQTIGFIYEYKQGALDQA